MPAVPLCEPLDLDLGVGKELVRGEPLSVVTSGSCGDEDAGDSG